MKVDGMHIPVTAYQLYCVIEREQAGRETVLSYDERDANIDVPHRIYDMDELVKKEYLQPIWKTTCCNTHFMAKPEEAAFCPGCGAELYDEATDSDRELLDPMGRDDLEVVE